MLTAGRSGDWTAVANVLGGSAIARAQQFATYYDANVAQVQAKTAGIPPVTQPKVYYTAGNPLQTEGQGSTSTSG